MTRFKVKSTPTCSPSPADYECYPRTNWRRSGRIPPLDSGDFNGKQWRNRPFRDLIHLPLHQLAGESTAMHSQATRGLGDVEIGRDQRAVDVFPFYRLD